MNSSKTSSTSNVPVSQHYIRIFLFALIFIGLGVLSIKIIIPFIKPALWALIAVLITWPIFNFIKRRSGLGTGWVAFFMTILLAVSILVAIVPLSVELSREAQDAFKASSSINWESIEKEVSKLPFVGDRIVAVEKSVRDGSGTDYLKQNGEKVISVVGLGVKGASQIISTLFLMIFFSFFLYRDGPSLAAKLKVTLLYIAGPQGVGLVDTASTTVRGAVYGAIVTALAQGIIAGIGYWMFGAPTPILLGCATFIFSFLPFGAPMIYLPVALYLISTGEDWYSGLFLIAWGVSLVSTADNILRPYFISQATNMSLLPVFIGVLGGVIAFGMIGVFLGPVVIAIILSILSEAFKVVEEDA